METNPIKAWDKLGRNGKIALVAGVLAISLLWYYRSKQKATAAATANAAAGSTTSADTTDSDTDSDTTADSSDYDDSSLDPTSSYLSGYEDAISAYGSSLDGSDIGYTGDVGRTTTTNGTDTTSGAGATNSTDPSTTSTPAPVNVTVNTPSSATGGGAPSTPSAAVAHTVAPATSTGNLLASGAILAPSGTRTTKTGYVTVGTGNGNYQYIPTSLAPKGYTIYHSISSSKPVSTAKGLGNGLWAVPVGTAEPS